MTEQIVFITSDYITLGQLLKNEAIIGSGGMAKWYLMETEVLVNNEIEQRRGRKLYSGDQIVIPNENYRAIIQSENVD